MSTDVVTGDRPTQFAVAVGMYSQSAGFLAVAHAYTPIIESTSPNRYQATITTATFNVGAGESFAVGLLRQWQNASSSPVAFVFFDSPDRASGIISPEGGAAQPSSSGFAFAVVGIGAGLGAAAGGLAVAASSGPYSDVAYAGYYYCRKHRVPVWSAEGRLWCPVERKFHRA